MNIEEAHNRHTNNHNRQYLLKNLIGSLLTLGIDSAIIILLLVPQIRQYVDTAMASQEPQAWLSLFFSLLITTIMSLFPVVLVIRGIIDFKQSYRLSPTTLSPDVVS